MMRANAAWVVLFALTLASLGAPMLSAGLWCAESGDDECCEVDCSLDCTLCACCSHLPRTTLIGAAWALLDPPADGLRGERLEALPEPPPKKVFHVPKALA
ncbi:MAG: hypothetical protein SX243_01075 [Acidobacteriota bacterium]|nr:hypothetical protein [Acidobacteriota bacterium]